MPSLFDVEQHNFFRNIAYLIKYDLVLTKKAQCFSKRNEPEQWGLTALDHLLAG